MSALHSARPETPPPTLPTPSSPTFHTHTNHSSGRFTELKRKGNNHALSAV
jgi:hypothetical protein